MQICTLGKDSFIRQPTNKMLIKDNVNENIAGQNHQLSSWLSTPHNEKAAPVMGPMMNPMAKAIPIKAWNEKLANNSKSENT